jgi:hypothetical protein
MRLPYVILIYFDSVGQTQSRTSKAITFQKISFLHPLILPSLFHSQSCNLGGSKKEDKDTKLLLETKEPHFKLWLTEDLTFRPVSYWILLAQLAPLSHVEWMSKSWFVYSHSRYPDF